jgi:hypothetical protein
MVLLGDEAQVDARFVLFRDSANLDARLVHGLRRTYHRLENHFQTHPMVLLGDEAQVDARFGLFGDRLILTQHRCTVCAERNIGLEIILDAPDSSPM